MSTFLFWEGAKANPKFDNKNNPYTRACGDLKDAREA